VETADPAPLAAPPARLETAPDIVEAAPLMMLPSRTAETRKVTAQTPRPWSIASVSSAVPEKRAAT
jgi:hypothetical protein